MLLTGFAKFYQSGSCEEFCLAGWLGICYDLGHKGIRPEMELLLLLDLCKTYEELVVVF